jgi:hypothetical protein
MNILLSQKLCNYFQSSFQYRTVYIRITPTEESLTFLHALIVLYRQPAGQLSCMRAAAQLSPHQNLTRPTAVTASPATAVGRKAAGKTDTWARRLAYQVCCRWYCFRFGRARCFGLPRCFRLGLLCRFRFGLPSRFRFVLPVVGDVTGQRTTVATIWNTTRMRVKNIRLRGIAS